MSDLSCCLPKERRSLLLINLGDFQESPHAPGSFCQKKESSVWKAWCRQKPAMGRGPTIPSIRQQEQMGLPTAQCWWDFWESWPSRRGKCHRPNQGKIWLSNIGNSPAQQEVRQLKAKENHGSFFSISEWPWKKQKLVKRGWNWHLWGPNKENAGWWKV